MTAAEATDFEDDGSEPDTGAETDPSLSWFTHDGSEELDVSFKDYTITASPNDFNISTLIAFIDRGPIKIPSFQRNYVWDIKRASKLIESILIGLPVPQIFLYEEGRNSFLVIDGQQRLMSVYYFVKGRFPRREQRPAIRRIMSERGILPPEILADDKYFRKFNLSLPGTAPNQRSRFHGKNYGTLAADQMTFDLRTIRNVILKQNAPEEASDTSVFEIFNRLNTGGVNLRPQEIRTSLFHSNFMDVLNRINLNSTWRSMINQLDPDLHAKDVEIILRAYAMVADGSDYAEPMSNFLNLIAKKSRKLDAAKLQYIEQLFAAFFNVASTVSPDSLRVERSGRFSIALFEAAFWAACDDAFKARSLDVWPLTDARLNALKTDAKFIEATQYGIGRAVWVKQRYERARALLAS